MSLQDPKRKYGGFVKKVMNGQLPFLIEVKEQDVLIVLGEKNRIKHVTNK